MKASKFLKSISLIIVLLMSVSVSFAQQDTKAKKNKKGEKTSIFQVEMDCQSCVKTIEKNIAYEKGVTTFNWHSIVNTCSHTTNGTMSF